MELYFVRHGQSQNNANENNPHYEESPDPVLTDMGIEQARYLAEFFEKNQQITKDAQTNHQNRYGFGVTHIYSSLMDRAVNTAMPTARALGVPFAAWVDIHEEGGIFSRDKKDALRGLPGKPRSYFERHFPEFQLPDHLDESGWWNRPFEPEAERRQRADRFLTDLIARHGDRDGQPEDRVAIFSHGGFFMHLMCSMLKLPWRQAAHGRQSWFYVNNASISRIDLSQKEIKICYVNRTDHLPDHLITH